VSAVLSAEGAQERHGLAHVLQSWRSLRLVELAIFALAGLLFGIIDLSSLLEVDVSGHLLEVTLRNLTMPVIACVILLLFWLPADRSDPQHPHRVRRLAVAALLGSLASIVVVSLLDRALPWPSVIDLMRAHKHLPPYPGPSVSGVLGDTLWILLPSGMMVAVIELLRRRRRSEIQVARMLDEHGHLRRRAMASRLATLQAQVEPQLLFDALVDIEQAYGRHDADASKRMDLLIRHLRVALPRLRESGSTLEAEAELLESYLGLIQGLGGTPLHFLRDWPEDLRLAALPPMLLLPLLQRALRVSARPPTSCTLSAEKLWGGEGRLRIGLAFNRPALCGDDDELQSLNERLIVLAGGPARLQCHSTRDETRFTLELP
jgi:hypothetical protein